MQHRTSQLLYDYWDSIRNDRIAPRRYEIEPVKIANILAETFIIDCAGLQAFRFRLAGTRICEQFGRELRGSNFLELWDEQDGVLIRNMLNRVVLDADIGVLTFDGFSETGSQARFEMVLLPLIHTGHSVNRMMGSITAIDAPLWLGARDLVSFALVSIDVQRPSVGRDRVEPSQFGTGETAEMSSTLVSKGARNFRVFDGGREDNSHS